MKTAKLYTFLLLPLTIFLFIISFSTICPSQTEKSRMSVGYTTTSLPDVDIKDATAALNIWIKEVGEKAGFETKSILYENGDALIRDFAAKKLDIAFLRTLEYLAAGKKIDAEIRQTSTKNGKATVKYLLLVLSNSRHTQIKDLKGTRFAILKNNDLGMMFLNTQLLKAKLPEAREFFSETQEKSKESQALLSVFFGQADASLVTDTSYKTMAELNPQIGQKLKIIAASIELHEIVNFMQKSLDEAIKEKIVQASIRLKETERGKQMLILFNTDCVERSSDERLETTKQLVAEYEKLKQKK